MIKEITYPINEQEWYVKGVMDILETEIYFEIPATFIDGVLNKEATDAKINDQIEIFTRQIERRKNQTVNG